MPDESGAILRTLGGHSEMATFELKAVPGGFWCWVPCRLERGDLPAEKQAEWNPVEGHWLAPVGRVTISIGVQTEAYVWPTAREAIWALGEWVRQER